VRFYLHKGQSIPLNVSAFVKIYSFLSVSKADRFLPRTRTLVQRQSRLLADAKGPQHLGAGLPSSFNASYDAD
jgi:hypothetical protein